MKSEAPLVSVAIPAYKIDYLREAIQSVLSQSYSNFELIIVDDCSPNNITCLLDEFDDSRIKYFRNQRNLGSKDPSQNWNQCLKYSHGDFFCLLCDDDVYDKDFIEEMLTLASLYPECNVFRSRVKIVDEVCHKVIDFYPSSPSWESCEDYIWHVCKGKRCQTISEWMLRMQHIKACGGYFNLPYAWGADYVSIYRFALDGGIASTTKLLVSYRKSPKAISSQLDEKGLDKLRANYMRRQAVCSLVLDSPSSFDFEKLIGERKIMEDMLLLTNMKFRDLLLVFSRRAKYEICLSTIVSAIKFRVRSYILR